MAKVLFLQNVWIEYYGVMQLSALLKNHGHSVDIIFGSDDAILKEIKKEKPDLIAISCMSVQWNWVKSLSTYLKKHGVECPIILGGIHATMYPEEAIAYCGIDMICVGEGENLILELCHRLAKKEPYADIPGLWIKQSGNLIRNAQNKKLNQEQLNALPFADRQLYTKYKYFRKYPFVIFVGSRGCPFQCSFCEIPEINRMYPGSKSTYYRDPELFISEIEAAKRAGLLDGKLVMFTDSTFNSNKRWFLEVMRLYREREINIPFSCNLRVDLVDENQVIALKEAGCTNVRFGVESGDEDIRNRILVKSLNDEKLYNCAEILRKHGIPFITFNLFGSPGETYDQAWKTIYANQRLKPSAVGSYIFVLFPGIRATNEAIASGHIDAQDLEKLDIPPYNLHLSLLAVHPDRNPEIIKICNLQKFAILVIRYPWLEPIVRAFCRLPPLAVFNLVYSLLQALEWCKWSTKTKIRRIIYEGFLNYSALLGMNKRADIFSRISYRLNQRLLRQEVV